MSRTALVTGILGQDGSLLAELLLSRDYRVHGWVRPGSLGKDPGEQKRFVAQRCELSEVDVADATAVREAFARVQPDEVYHLAAVHHSSEHRPAFDGERNEAMARVNFGSTLALADAILKLRPSCRFVYAGSSQMYEATAADTRVDEDTPHSPATFYGVTKAQSRELISFYRRKRGLHGSVAILFNHESTRRDPRFLTRKVTSAAARISAGSRERLELLDLGARVDWSSAEDIVDGLYRIAQAADPADYVLGSGFLTSVVELLDDAFGHAGLNWRDHVTAPSASGPSRGLVADPSCARRELSWVPARSFRNMIREMVDHDAAVLAQR